MNEGGSFLYEGSSQHETELDYSFLLVRVLIPGNNLAKATLSAMDMEAQVTKAIVLQEA